MTDYRCRIAAASVCAQMAKRAPSYWGSGPAATLTLVTAFLLSSAVALAGADTLTVLTYNTKHGGTVSAGCPACSAPGQQLIISQQTPRPEVIVLQEMPKASVPEYVSGLNLLYGFPDNPIDGFQIRFHDDCGLGNWVNNACTGHTGQGVAILVAPNRPIKDSEGRDVAAPSYYASARGWVRVAIDVGGTTVQIFGVHLVPNDPNGTSYQASRLIDVEDLKNWARPFAHDPTLIAGDFNAAPTTPEIANPTSGMAAEFTDAWRAAPDPGNTTAGKTHKAITPGSRIDYWFARSDNHASITGVVVVPVATTQSDHRPVVASYTIMPCVACVPTSPSDSFDGNFLDPKKWANAIFSGSSALDPKVHLAATNQRLEIGPMVDAGGQHYNGITAIGGTAFRNASASVELVAPPSIASGAYAMFSVGTDADNFYRIFATGGALFAQRKINGVKLAPDIRLPYVPSQPIFLRIRHDGTNVLFDTAPAAGAVPGPWTDPPAYSEAWSPSVNLALMRFEIKAGTSGTGGEGTAVWDNFTVAPSSIETLLLADDFTAVGPAPDAAKWSGFLVTSSADPSFPATQVGGRLEIGPMPMGVSGSRYNGVASASAYDFTDAYAYVKLPAPPPNGTADQMMLTLPMDAANWFRVWVQGGPTGPTMTLQEKVNGTKTDLTTGRINLSLYPFLRLRHDSGAGTVTLEVAPDAGGIPGGWIEPPAPFPFGRNVVAARFAVTALRFELKAGTTTASETTAPTLAFDAFRAARP